MTHPNVSLPPTIPLNQRRQVVKTRLVALSAFSFLGCALTFSPTTKAAAIAEPYIFNTLAPSEGANSVAAAISFRAPASVATDRAGNLYIADTDNHAIRKISPTGIATVLAGAVGRPGSTDGVRNAARFYYPKGVATDGAGNIYVADTANHTIRKITPGGLVTTLAGLAGSVGNSDGSGSAARFYYPYGIATNRAGDLYVADTFN